MCCAKQGYRWCDQPHLHRRRRNKQHHIQSSDFAGIHFTGSTPVFQSFFKTIGDNIGIYKSYPRLVGETGGKDFVVAHPSAHVGALVTALARGAFEYQGQKCSAASRAYIPGNLWKAVKAQLSDDIASFKIGTYGRFPEFHQCGDR
jgi:1-pyrroline-5-carboxylate dehydrogenase